MHDTSGAFGEARACADQALAVSRQAASAADEARSLLMLGLASLHVGRLDEARVHAQAALTIYRSLGDLVGQHKPGADKSDGSQNNPGICFRNWQDFVLLPH